MAGTSVRGGSRPHDWAQVVLGLSAVPSPLVLAMDGVARWALIVLGALVALDGIVSLGMPGMVYGEGVRIVLGLPPFLSPWVIGYTPVHGRRVGVLGARRPEGDRRSGTPAVVSAAHGRMVGQR